MLEYNDFTNTANKVLELAGNSILSLKSSLNEDFNKICYTILNCPGKIILSGVGKSGHIARKIAATMASTGTPAFFMHPTEGSHGDLGAITKQDVIIMFSNSGETDELITIIPVLKQQQITIISFTGNAKSKIAELSNLHFEIKISHEACPLNLAPTTSTTCALVIGDAIAICLLEAKKFNKDDFAKNHPSGRLGKRLLLKVQNLMHVGEQIPVLPQNASLPEGIIEMSKKCFGLLLVTDKAGNNLKKKLVGVISDGDLRRILEKKINIHNTKLYEVMNQQFKAIEPENLVTEALDLMQKYKIFSLPVIKHENIMGIFNMHDVLKSGII